MAERGIAGLQLGVRRGGIGIEPGHVREQQREIGGGGTGREAGHRDRAGGVVNPGDVGRLVRDGLEQLVRIALQPGLNQAVRLIAPGEVHRAVEVHPVKPPRIDVAHKVFDRERGVDVIEIDLDRAERGDDPHPHDVAERRGLGQRRGGAMFRRCGGGERGKHQRRGEEDESAVHAAQHGAQKAALEGAYGSVRSVR